MRHQTVERFAEELRHFSTSERKTVLLQLSALVHEQMPEAQQQQGVRKRTVAFFMVAFLLVLISSVYKSAFGEVGNTSGRDGRLHILEHSPLRPMALETVPSSAACNPPQLVQVRTAPLRPITVASSSSESVRVPQWRPRDRSEYPAHAAFDHPRDALLSVRPKWNTSDFPLLLCIGQGKTATKSLNKALVMLGYQTAHFYGAGVYGLLYDNVAEKPGYNFMFNVWEEKHVDAVLDTPVVEFFNEILLSYPKAKVILTIRKPRSWLKSQQKFYGGYARGCHNWLAPWRRGSNLIYGTECPSKEQALKRYVQHNRNVYEMVPHDRLLIMDIPGGDGWEKLCPFIGVPVPNNMTFPSRH